MKALISLSVILGFMFGVLAGLALAPTSVQAQSCQTIRGTINTQNRLSSAPDWNVNLTICNQ